MNREDIERGQLIELLKQRTEDPTRPSKPGFVGSSIEGVNALATYLYGKGGLDQQDRMIRDKRKSLDKAVLYSYQGARIKKVGASSTEPPVQALINPNKNKVDYDEKIVSVGFEYDFKPGDIFEWCGTGTYWLIYLQELTELAYFRGEIRRCSYELKWEDDEGIHSTYAYVRGPVETKINYIQKHGISVDDPNYSLHVYMPLTDSARKYFQRYSKFYLQGDDSKTCWRVEASDWISTPNILEFTAVEYYANEAEDDLDEGLVGALIAEKVDPNPVAAIGIIGETFIKPKVEMDYYYNGALETGEKWFVKEKNLPVEKETYVDNKGVPHIKLKWTSSYSGQFDICYGTFSDYVSKTIVIESLF